MLLVLSDFMVLMICCIIGILFILCNILGNEDFIWVFLFVVKIIIEKVI